MPVFMFLNKNLIKKVDGKTYLDMPDFLEKELDIGQG